MPTDLPTEAPVAPATMTLSGRKFLQALAGKARSGCFLEVGPLFGSSTQAIDAGRRLDAPLHTIDTFEAAPWVKRRLGQDLSREAFDIYTRHIPDLVVHEGFAPDVVADTWKEPIGFFFDDATHGDPGWSNNFNFFSRFFTGDAIVCGDDFAGGWPDIPRNVTRIAESWGAGLYVIGRVWAITKAAEERIEAAATECDPELAGARIETTHDGATGSAPAMCWSKGVHQFNALSSFRLTGASVEDVRFTTYAADGTLLRAYRPGDEVALSGVAAVSMAGPADLRFQLCLAEGNRTSNTASVRVGATLRITPNTYPVAIRLLTADPVT